MYILVYIDDIIIISSSSSATDRLIHQLNVDFAVKDLGTLNFFLGIEVHHRPDGLVLTQQKYISHLLSRTNMQSANGASTPMVATEKLSRHDGHPLSDSDITRYRSVVGALQYLTITRPDIAFSVNKVCQFLAFSLDAREDDEPNSTKRARYE